MARIWAENDYRANPGNGQSVSNGSGVSVIPTVPDQTVSQESDWFSDLAERLHPKDAGLALYLDTGMQFEERTCYRYASGERKVAGYFIRELLRSKNGQTYLAALLDGIPWWRELQRLASIGRAVVEITKPV